MKRNKVKKQGQGPFDANSELRRIKERRSVMRRRRYNRSVLERYRAELVKLRQAGASFGDLVVWLRTVKHLRVERSTVCRYLKKLPELMVKE